MKRRLATLLLIATMLTGCSLFERPTEEVRERDMGGGVVISLPVEAPALPGDVIVEKPTGELSDAGKVVSGLAKTGVLGIWGDLLAIAVALVGGYVTVSAIEKRAEKKKKLLAETKEVKDEIT